jgi:secondary thiamine-phosphate synthase enzyme
MPVETKTFSVQSRGETDVINITGKVSELIRSSKIKNGIVTVFVPGSTASVSTIEFEPNLVSDFKAAIERLVPSDVKYKHTETWGDDNGKSHCRATLMGPGITIPFRDGKLLLGTWQNLVIIDFDVPARTREVVLQIMGE